MPLIWRCTGFKEAGEAGADFPDERHSLFDGDSCQPPTIGGETACRSSFPVTFQDVQACGSLEVVHHDGAFACPYREFLGAHVEIDARIASSKLLSQDHAGEGAHPRFHNLGQDFRCGFKD